MKRMVSPKSEVIPNMYSSNDKLNSGPHDVKMVNGRLSVTKIPTSSKKNLIYLTRYSLFDLLVAPLCYHLVQGLGLLLCDGLQIMTLLLLSIKVSFFN